MDILAHGLWAAAAATRAEPELKRKIRVGWATFWGVFPDLFAFTIPITLSFWQRFADPAQSAWRHGPHGPGHMELAWQLYQVSHSFITFSVVFGLVWLIAHRPYFEMLAWLLHILIDIPSHTVRFFPTPFLWPISSYRVSGISWANPWFMLCNYSALAITWFLLWRWRRRLTRKAQLEMDGVSRDCPDAAR